MFLEVAKVTKIQNRKHVKELHEYKERLRILRDANKKYTEAFEKIEEENKKLKETIKNLEREKWDQKLRISFLENQLLLFKKGKI